MNTRSRLGIHAQEHFDQIFQEFFRGNLVMLITECDREERQDSSLPYVELCFRIIGQTLRADHGYGLYSGSAHCQEELHNLAGVSIQTIQGMPDKQGVIHLSDRSKWRICLPGDKVPLVYPLAGKQLTIGKHAIRLGIPQIFVLQPAARLRVIKLLMP